MEWLFFALLTALLDAAKDGLSKKLLQNMDPQVLAMVLLWLTLPFLLPILFLEFPTPTPLFWWAALGSALLNTLATTLYVLAIGRSDLSLVVPLLALSPVILLFTSPWMIGETSTMWGGVGVALVAVGTWWLKGEESHRGLLAPWRALLADSGARAMLGVTLIWGFSANLDKMAVQESTPLFFSLVVVALQAVFLTLVAWPRRRTWSGALAGIPLSMGVLAAILAAMIYCNMMAISLGVVAYVIAIKRFSVLIGVLVGAWFFGEDGLRQRLFGASLMVAGMALVVIGG